MHILVFITSFIIMSIVAASDGDWSGIIFIGKVIGFIAFYACICFDILSK